MTGGEDEIVPQSTITSRSSQEEASASIGLEKMTMTTTTTTTVENGGDATITSPNNNNEKNDNTMRKSALQENIERKGKHAYYFAHAHKANGPEWDGKAEPRLLSKTKSQSSSMDNNDDFVLGNDLDENNNINTYNNKTKASFDYHKSNITSYAFCDEGKVVKLYISMENVGETCTEQDVQLDFTDHSFCLVVQNYKEQEQCLSFGKLTAKIVKASFKLKKDRIILTLTKEDEAKTWHTINDKGEPDHELV